jgi:hypothetical protein
VLLSVADVKLDSLGFAFVRLYIKPNNTLEMRHLPYKVDSGANRTTISKKWMNDLGYDDAWIRSGRLLEGYERPTVATGEPIDHCYIVTLPEIQLGDCVGYNWPFLVSLSDIIQFRLLLGTDSMQFFNWNFKYENRICKFELIPGKRQLLFNQKEQSIHAVSEIE